MEYLNEFIVVDTDTPLVYIGRLVEESDSFLKLEDVAIYYFNEARVPVEQYLVECAAHGIAACRKTTLLKSDRVVSVSRLSDIIVPQ